MHRVHSMEIEIQAGSAATATTVLDRVTRIFAPRLSPLADRVLSEVSRPDLVHRLDVLEVDVGCVSLDEFEADFCRKLELALRTALVKALGGSDAVVPTLAGLELLELFARTGNLPWWANSRSGDPVDAALAAMIASKPRGLAMLLVELADDEAALVRLARHLDTASQAALVEAIVPSGADDLPGTRNRPGASPCATPPTTTPLQPWARGWMLAALARAGLEARQADAEHTRVASTGRAVGDVRPSQTLPAVRSPVGEVAPARMPNPSFEPENATTEIVGTLQREAEPKPMRTSVPAHGLVPRIGGVEINDEIALGASSRRKGTAGADDTSSEPRDPGAGSEAHSDPPLPAGVALPSPFSSHQHSSRHRRVPEPNDPASITQRYAPSHAASTSTASMSRSAADPSHARTPFLLPQASRNAHELRVLPVEIYESPETIPSLHAPVPTRFEPDRATTEPRSSPPPSPDPHQALRRRILARLDDLYVEDAGMVLLWPFLPRFFTRLGLLDPERRFLDEPSCMQAIALLEVLVTADTDPPEYRLPLAKLLCGCAPETTYALERPLEPTVLDECEHLLAALIAQVPVLHDMPPTRLREGFLRRPGILSTRDGAWLLRVERRAHDVVLEHFPWSWEWVPLPWMLDPLRVEW